jgi:hypothetical protein
MRQNGNPILLLLTIALMLRSTGINAYRHGTTRVSLMHLITLDDDINKFRQSFLIQTQFR